jgi:transcription elongation GreA/GreB family factor
MDEKRALLTGGSSGSADTTARVRQIDAALQKIQRVMDSVMVAGPSADADKVGFGASVRIRDNHGEEETYQIVGPEEAEPAEGRISSISPLAQTLLNSRVWVTQCVSVRLVENGN